MYEAFTEPPEEIAAPSESHSQIQNPLFSRVCEWFWQLDFKVTCSCCAGIKSVCKYSIKKKTACMDKSQLRQIIFVDRYHLHFPLRKECSPFELDASLFAVLQGCV